jgi:transposase
LIYQSLAGSGPRWVVVTAESSAPLPSYEELVALNAVLAARLEQALARIAELEARLNMSSKNSSKPPSSDGLVKPAPKSLRKKTGRGPGRPAGQPGTTLERVTDPDVIVRHVPAACAGCGDALSGDATEVAVTVRQVFDIPEPTMRVTQHELVTLACACGHHTPATAPPEASAPVAYGPRIAAVGIYLLHGQFLSIGRTTQTLAEAFGVPVSTGTVACWVKRTALGLIDTVLPVIRDRIAAAPVAHFDETGWRTAGRLAWLHSASTTTDVLYTVHSKRGRTAMDDAGVLPVFTGVAVHDAWAPYDTYTDAVHALCNAHVLRELVYVVDTTNDEQLAGYARQAITALGDLKTLTETVSTDTALDLAVVAVHTRRLRSAVVLGAQTTAARDTGLTRKYHALFNRLRDRHDDYLRFVTHPGVPFDNNAAEQTIRMPKLRIKVSGCMRTLTGAQHFAAIRSYTTTAARHGIGILDALIHAVQGKPWIPATA